MRAPNGIFEGSWPGQWYAIRPLHILKVIVGIWKCYGFLALSPWCHSLTPKVPCPGHVTHILTVETQATSETRSWLHQRLCMQSWALGAGSMRDWSKPDLGRTALGCVPWSPDARLHRGVAMALQAGFLWVPLKMSGATWGPTKGSLSVLGPEEGPDRFLKEPVSSAPSGLAPPGLEFFFNMFLLI